MRTAYAGKHTPLWHSPNGRWHLVFHQGSSGATYYTLYDRNTGHTCYPDRGSDGKIFYSGPTVPKYVDAACDKHIAPNH